MASEIDALETRPRSVCRLRVGEFDPEPTSMVIALSDVGSAVRKHEVVESKNGEHGLKFWERY